jgi:hypothetical protein
MIETLKNGWQSFVGFLAENDAATLMGSIRKLDYNEMLGNPLVWVISIVLLGLAIWRKQIKLMLLTASAICFVLLLQSTLPSSGQTLSLDGLLKFGGGTLALVGVNFYFLLIREK